MGPTAVIAIGAIRLLLRSQPSMEWDTGDVHSQGLDPREARARLRQVAVAFPGRASARWRAHPRRQHAGPDRADMRRIPFTKATRPLYPLDPI